MSVKHNWSPHFDEAFRQMDAGFRDIDWRDMQDVRHTSAENMADPLLRKTHTLIARSWKSRRRMAWLFLWLAWRIISRGRATVRL